VTYPPALHVSVSLEDLALGEPSCVGCPIHRAIERQGFRNFTVNEWRIVFSDGPAYHVPPRAREFIQKYDAGYLPRNREFVFRSLAALQAVLL
jgi:hypothetical protein